MKETIRIVNARENNLKHLTLEIPKEKLVVLAGVSGSGKSTLAFDTLAAESSRQWQASLRIYCPDFRAPGLHPIQALRSVLSSLLHSLSGTDEMSHLV